MTRYSTRVALVVIVGSVAALAGDAQGGISSGLLPPAGVIALEGVDGRIDHMAIDSALHRLYVAALGNNTVEVLDLVDKKRAQTIKNIEEPQGICVIPDTHAVVVASGGGGECRVYDQSLALRGSISGLDDADNVRFDAASRRIYVGYGNGALALIDPDKPEKLRESKLPGHPESFQLEQSGTRLFVNIPSAGQVAVIAGDSGAITATWPVPDAKDNFPMALDEQRHLVFVGCRRPAKLLVFDAGTAKCIASVPCAGDADDLFYDDIKQRIYVSGGEGIVTVIQQSGADQYSVLGRVPTAPGARTACFDSASRRLYVAVPRRGAQVAEIRIFEVPS